MRRTRYVSGLLVLLLGAAALLEPAQRRKKKTEEELTQTLEILPDPPSAITAETQRLTFHVAPLSARGLLSQQIRDALKALQRQVRGAAIVKLRAFVAGTGDLRRVQAIVSETFSERKLALPAVSVIQVGALPLEGTQLALEAIAVDKKRVNPHGLAFFSGQAVSDKEPLKPAAPLVEQSLANLGTAVRAAGLTNAEVLKVTCLLSTLQDIETVRVLAGRAFPGAAHNFIQLQRSPASSVAECEAVGRLRAPTGAPVRFLNPDGLPSSPNYSQVALVSAPKIAMTGTQLAFRFQDADVRLAFERLKRALESVGTGFSQVVMSNIYPLSNSISERIRAIRFEFYDKSKPPASTMLVFEGLPSLDASFAVEVVAVATN